MAGVEGGAGVWRVGWEFGEDCEKSGGADFLLAKVFIRTLWVVSS
jgi:hypothetical protein